MKKKMMTKIRLEFRASGPRKNWKKNVIKKQRFTTR